MHCFSLHQSLPALGLLSARKMVPYYPGSSSKVGRPAAPMGKRTHHFQKAPVTDGAWVDGQGHRGGVRGWCSICLGREAALGRERGRWQDKVGWWALKSGICWAEKLGNMMRSLRTGAHSEEKWDCINDSINNTQRKCPFPYCVFSCWCYSD